MNSSIAVGLGDGSGELAITTAQWTVDRCGPRLGDGPPAVMYVSVAAGDELGEPSMSPAIPKPCWGR